MRTLLKGGYVHLKDAVRQTDILLEKDRIVAVCDDLDASQLDHVRELFGFHVFPGFVDVHVHLREPGFFYKESILTGTIAAARGGFTSVFTMPNLNPAPDDPEHLKAQTDIISRDAAISVYPYGTITKGQKGGGALSDMAGMAPFVKGYSDDGRGIQDAALMKRAMLEARRLGRVIVAHCEDENELKPGGAIHAGRYSERSGIPGINAKSEYAQLARDIALVRETGCDYHVCHVSSKESVALIRSAKKEGLPITAETAPHYLILCEGDLKDEGRFKMNPPLRGQEDRQALIDGLLNGTIDTIATDHAPHSHEEKSKGLLKSAFGVVGLETSFPLMYTHFVKTGRMSLETLLERMVYTPACRFGLQAGIEAGMPADLTVWDLEKQSVIDSDAFLSKGRATPFEGEQVYGQCRLTIGKGRISYEL